MQGLFVVAVVVLGAAWRGSEGLPMNPAVTPSQKPWSWPLPQPNSSPRVTAPAATFGSRLLPAGDAGPRLVTATGGVAKPRLIIPGGRETRPRPMSPARGDAKLRLVTPAGTDARPRPITPARGDAKFRFVTPAGGDADLNALVPDAGERSPGSVFPGGEDAGSVFPAGEDVGSVFPGGEDVRPIFPAVEDVGSVSPGGEDVGLAFPGGEDIGSLFPAEEDTGPVFPAGEDIGPVFPAGEDIGPVFSGGEDTGPVFSAIVDGGSVSPVGEDVGPVFPGGDDTSLLGSGASPGDEARLEPATGDIANHASKSLAGNTAEIGSRFGFPAKGRKPSLFGPMPNAPSRLEFPASPSGSGEVTVLLPEPPVFPPPPAYSSSIFDLPPQRQEGGGFLGNLLSYFANKLFMGSQGSGGGLMGLLSSLFAMKSKSAGSPMGALAMAAQEIKDGAKEGMRLANGELVFQKQQKTRSLQDKVQDMVQAVGEVGQSQYRGILQKKEAMQDYMSESAGNMGEFADKATVATYKKMEESMKAMGRMLRDLKLSFLDSMVAQGQAATDLVKKQAGATDRKIGAMVGAKREATRDSIKAMTDAMGGQRDT